MLEIFEVCHNILKMEKCLFKFWGMEKSFQVNDKGQIYRLISINYLLL